MFQAQRLFDVPYFQLKNFPNENMFVTKTNGNWVGVHTKSFLDQAMMISRGLIALGV